MQTILITGGLGFVGSHTCIKFLEKGFNVVIIDSLINSKKETFDRIKKVVSYTGKKKGSIFCRIGDLRNKDWLTEVFNEFKKKEIPINAVLHFAGLKSVRESYNYPLKYWDLNINATISLLTVMESFSCFTLIFSSSATVYRPKISKLMEISVCDPISTYGNTKLCIEKILENLFRNNPKKWRIANLRYFNPAGAHKSGLIGEDLTKNPENIFPSIIKSIEDPDREFFIFGNDWPTKDGTCIRDYIHIMDLADGHYRTHSFLSSYEPQIININIGTGIGTSVLELILLFQEINKCKINFKFKDKRKGDAPYLVADNSLALKILDWKPKLGLKEICQDVWRNYFS